MSLGEMVQMNLFENAAESVVKTICNNYAIYMTKRFRPKNAAELLSLERDR